MFTACDTSSSAKEGYTTHTAYDIPMDTRRNCTIHSSTGRHCSNKAIHRMFNARNILIWNSFVLPCPYNAVKPYRYLDYLDSMCMHNNSCRYTAQKTEKKDYDRPICSRNYYSCIHPICNHWIKTFSRTCRRVIYWHIKCIRGFRVAYCINYRNRRRKDAAGTGSNFCGNNSYLPFLV